MRTTRILPALALLLAVSACAPPFDESAPRITEGPTASVVRDTSVTVAWLTSERANSLVEYGETTDYGTVEIDNLYLLTHVVTIRNLEPQTTYHLRAMSYDVFGNGPARSGDLTVTTLEEQPPPEVVITEVMPSPVTSTVGEYIELYNGGVEAIDLVGFTFTDGDSTDTLQPFAGGATLLAPGDYGLVVDADYVDGTYDLPSGTVLVTTGDSTLGNGISTDDPISLFAPGDSVAASTYGTPADAFDAVPITTVTTGTSIERRNVDDADADGNWCESIDPSGSTPGAPNSGC